MSNRAWMPLHLDAYLADTGHLTTLEHGAYLLLIMHYWRNGGLPEDERMIARVARLSKDEWAESRDVLASLFRDGWRHKRIDEELVKADDIIAKRKAAADARHGKSKGDASAEHMQSKCSDTGALPLTDNLSDVGANAPTSPEPEKSAPVASSPTVFELPCVSGENFPVTEADVAEWRQSFPAVDIPQQLAAARSWLVANPTRRKTRRGMRKFVVSWMDRRQNNSRPADQPTARGSPYRGREDPFAALNDISRMKGWSDEPAEPRRNYENDQRIPPERAEHSGAIVDLRRGSDWH